MLKNNRIFFVLMLTVSLIWLIFLSTKIIEGIQTQQWHSTQGTIVESNIVEIKNNNGRYHLKVMYQYYVKGNSYTGNEYSYIDRGRSLDEATELAKLYPKAGSVTVYFDKDEPQNALLVRGIDYLAYFFWFVLIGLIAYSTINLLRLNKNTD